MPSPAPTRLTIAASARSRMAGRNGTEPASPGEGAMP
jgi:hypothetical protein